MVFIRAPRIVETGPEVEVLARRDGVPVLVRQGKFMAATFHPELPLIVGCTSFFVETVAGAPEAVGKSFRLGG